MPCHAKPKMNYQTKRNGAYRLYTSMAMNYLLHFYEIFSYFTIAITIQSIKFFCGLANESREKFLSFAKQHIFDNG